MSILDTIIGVLQNVDISLGEAEGGANAVDENVVELQAAMEQTGMEYMMEKAASLKEPAELLVQAIMEAKQQAESLALLAIEMKQG